MVQQQSVLPGTNDLLELAASPVQVIEHPSWIAARETVLALVAAGPCVVVLLGPPGSGKTMLLRNLATTLDAQGRTACFLEFGDSQGEPGQADVVLVDEADRISPARLDQLSDPEHRARSLVLAAIPSAAERFCEIPGAIVVRLVPLSPDQACAFLAERLAQLELPVTCLTEAAWAGLVVHAQGVARLLIALLGLALFVAAEDGAEQVTDAHVEQAVAVRIGGGEEATLSEPDPASPDAPAFLAANPATNTAEDGVFRARPSRWRTAAAAVLATVCVLVPAALLTGSHYQETVRPGSDKAGTGAVTQAPRTAVADAKSEQIAGTTQVTAAPALPAPGTTSGPPVSQGAVSAASNEVASLPVTPPAPVAGAPTSTTPAIARESPPPPVVAPTPAAIGPATVPPPAAPADQQTAAPAPIEVVSKPPPLPAGALIRVVLIYPRGDNAAAHRAQGLAQELRSDGVGVGDPFPVASRAAKRGISYYFAQDEDAAGEIGRRLGGDYGDGKLVRPRPGAGLPRPGTIEIAVGSH